MLYTQPSNATIISHHHHHQLICCPLNVCLIVFFLFLSFLNYGIEIEFLTHLDWMRWSTNLLPSYDSFQRQQAAAIYQLRSGVECCAVRASDSLSPINNKWCEGCDVVVSHKCNLCMRCQSPLHNYYCDFNRLFTITTTQENCSALLRSVR